MSLDRLRWLKWILRCRIPSDLFSKSDGKEGRKELRRRNFYIELLLIRVSESQNNVELTPYLLFQPTKPAFQKLPSFLSKTKTGKSIMQVRLGKNRSSTSNFEASPPHSSSPRQSSVFCPHRPEPHSPSLFVLAWQRVNDQKIQGGDRSEQKRGERG